MLSIFFFIILKYQVPEPYNQVPGFLIVIVPPGPADLESLKEHTLEGSILSSGVVLMVKSVKDGVHDLMKPCGGPSPGVFDNPTAVWWRLGTALRS